MADLNVMMPYNKDAEQSVLGSVLIDPKCMQTAVRTLQIEDFYLPEHQQIYAAMLALYNNNESAIDPITVAVALKNTGFDNAKNYIYELAQAVPSTANIASYVSIIKEQAYLRSLIEVSQNILENATAPGADAKMILDTAEQHLYDIRQGSSGKGPRLLREIIINDVYGTLEKLNGPERELMKGIPTGFGMLDRYLTGLGRSDLILIGARPAMGKTSFALNLAHNITVASKRKCVFFSLEMTNAQLAERILASQSGIESRKFRTGELTEDEWVRLGNAVSVFSDTQLYFDDSSSITVPEMKSIVRQMKDVDCVIIDYLGLIQSGERAENRVQEVTKITKNLKQMAKDLNIPVVCCAQLNRGTEGRGKSHRPQLSDLRESGSIEQDADVVMFLYREEYYSGEVTEEEAANIDTNKTELIIAKNRHGATGTVQLVFDNEFTRFRAVENINEY